MALSAAEQAEMADLQGAGKSSLSPSEATEMAQLQKEVPNQTPSTLDTAIAGVQHGVKLLDYQRGAASVGLDRIVQALGGHAGATPEQDAAALDPTSAQIAPSYRNRLKNWGVPAGPTSKDLPSKMGIPGVIARHLPEVSARDAAGTGMDVGLDPMMYEGGALGRIAKLTAGVPGVEQLSNFASKVPSVISDAAKTAATKLYESGIKPIVQAGERFNNPNVGATLLKEGIWGTPSSIRAGMKAAATELKGNKDSILSTASDAGASASKDNAITPLFEKLQGLIRDQRITPDNATRILQDLTESKMRGSDLIAPKLMDVWKTDEGKALPGMTFDQLATRSPSIAQDLRRTLQKGYKGEVERSVGAALGPAAQEDLSSTNASLGDLINKRVQNASMNMATKYDKTPWLSPSEILTSLGAAGAGASLGHTAGYTAEGGLGALAAIKAVKALNSSTTRTGLGLLSDRMLNLPGASPVLDSATRRAISDLTRKSPYVVPAKTKE